MSRAGRFVNNILSYYGLELVRTSFPSSQTKFSYLDEERIIYDLLQRLNVNHKFAVDIAAGDGLTMSNTFFLYRNGWKGLAVEYDSKKFSKLSYRYKNLPEVNLCKCMVTPENVVALLKANRVPRGFCFLSLDIDGYDYFVLEQVLVDYRPSLICAEINEKIPTPIKFTVKWDPNYVYGGDNFYGQSLSQINILCEKHDYVIVDLEYNNVFLIPKEINPCPSLTPEEAYTKGYVKKSDRKEKFPWNADMEEVHGLSPAEAIEFVQKYFAKYNGKFICTL